MGDWQANTNQIGDVLMYHSSEDCGEINESGGVIEMTEWYDTMAYLTLAGGNYDDDGSDATSHLQYWGNEGEPPERQYRGRFQRWLSGQPITSASLLQLEADAKYDLEQVLIPRYAQSLTVTARIKAPKMIELILVVAALNGDERSIKIETPVEAKI